MNEKMTRKKRRSAGFSLGEVLIAILIMAMVTTIVAGGIPSAIRVYRNVTNNANAQLLMSTTVNTLRGWLDQADIKTAGGTTITFDTAGVGECEITVASDGIYIEEYKDSTVSEESYGKRLLIAEASGGGDLYSVFTGVDYDETTGVISITGIKVLDKDGNKVLGPTSFTTKTLGK